MPSDNFWKDRNVFITGCTGLLGSWLTKSLRDSGANIVGLIRDMVPQSNLNRSGFDNKITIVRGDVEDYCLLERTLNEYEIFEYLSNKLAKYKIPKKVIHLEELPKNSVGKILKRDL